MVKIDTNIHIRDEDAAKLDNNYTADIISYIPLNTSVHESTTPLFLSPEKMAKENLTAVC